MEFARFNQFPTLFQWRIDSSQMTECCGIRLAIQHLCNTHFTTIGLFDTEITRCQCAIDSILNRRRFHQFIYVGHIDNILVIFRRSPRPVIDFADSQFLHFANQFVQIIAKQIVQKCPRQFNAFVQIRIAVICRMQTQRCSYQFQSHIANQIQFLFIRFAMGKQIVLKHLFGKFAFFPRTRLAVHIDWHIRNRCSDTLNRFLLSQILV